MGFVGGAITSIVMAFVGISISIEAVLCLWAISIVLMLVRSRFICFAYSIGLLGLIQYGVGWFPDLETNSVIGSLYRLIQDIQMPGLLALVAVIHAVEALFMRTQGEKFATPLFIESKRGKIVGGYQLSGFWPLPLFLMIPMETNGSSLPWHTLFNAFGSAGGAMGWTIVAFPLVIGFTEMTITRLPKEKVVWSSNMLFLYSIIIFLLAVGSELWSGFIVPGCLAAIGLHELLIWYSRFQEIHASPKFVHDADGLLILGVIPNSPAVEMGIQIGERIHKVNGIKVRHKEELHAALGKNGAFCKLEILNLEGHSKFLQRAVFSGDHHQLGVILAPDQHAMYYVEAKETHLLTYLRKKLTGVSSNDKTQNM
jgi:membrane-associated protease RseP (regulator of RpoE activity)